jgi:adenylosuccinate lyase
LSRVVGEPHGGWVHWGATTQNITQTGDLLVLRQAHGVFLRLIGEALIAMADLAERSADMPIPGRTHGQHAVPATFGYKVAVWIDELLRHVERLKQAAPRLFVAMLGGGAGTYASLGKQGPPVQAGIGKQLGFGSMTVPSRALGDHLAENICLLGLLAATCGKIGREIYTLMKTEFGEVEEPVPPGTVGSSTMPQKRNPKLCQDIIAAAAEIRSTVPVALEAMMTEHEADRTTSVMMDAAEARAGIATGDMLSRIVEVLRGLRLDPHRMRANLDLGGGLIMAEAVMLDLGRTIGTPTTSSMTRRWRRLPAASRSPRCSGPTSGSAPTSTLRRLRPSSIRPPIPASARQWPATAPPAPARRPRSFAGRIRLEASPSQPRRATKSMFLSISHFPLAAHRTSYCSAT